MDFQNFGKHCSDSTCRQKDFLPFTCKFCEKTYCLDHRDVTSHECPKANIGDHQVIICPICLKTLRYDASTMSKDEYWNIHHATDCKPENYSKTKEERSKTCKGEGCKTRLTPLNTFSCRECKKDLCLKHRYEDQHVCTTKAIKKGNTKVEPKKAPVNQNKTVSTHKPSTQQRSCASDYLEEFCTVCGQGFTNLNDLINHAQRAHYCKEIM